MKFSNILQFLTPKDKKFFPLFEKAIDNLVVASKVLNDAVTTPSMERRKELIREIERLEHVGDEISHHIFHDLGVNFITPFDREDIHQLTSVMDDVLDFIQGTAKRLSLYKIQTIPESVVKLSDLIVKASESLHIAIYELRNMKSPEKIKEACIKINSFENQADEIYNNSLAKLFEEEKNAVEIIKMKEILYALETATDKCEDVANVLESIIVKNA